MNFAFLFILIDFINTASFIIILYYHNYLQLIIILILYLNLIIILETTKLNFKVLIFIYLKIAIIITKKLQLHYFHFLELVFQCYFANFLSFIRLLMLHFMKNFLFYCLTIKSYLPRVYSLKMLRTISQEFSLPKVFLLVISAAFLLLIHLTKVNNYWELKDNFPSKSLRQVLINLLKVKQLFS